MPKRAVDLTGRKFGKWEVVERLGSDSRGSALWLCVCTGCGNRHSVRAGRLRSGSSKQCMECSGTAFKDMAGQSINGWKVISRERTTSEVQWLCRCLNCGQEKSVSGRNLRSGMSKQCRTCALKKAGRTRSKGCGPIFEIRMKLGLSQKEVARKVGISPRAIHDCEKQGRFLSDRSRGVEAQIKFNSALPKHRQPRKNYHVRKDGKRRAVAFVPCSYCGALVEKPIYEEKRTQNSFCNLSHAALFRCHGPMKQDEQQEVVPLPMTTNAEVRPEDFMAGPKKTQAELMIGLKKAQEAAKKKAK